MRRSAVAGPVGVPLRPNLRSPIRNCEALIPFSLLGGFEVRENLLGSFPRHDFAQLIDSGAMNVGNTAEFAKEFARGLRSDTRDIAEG